MSKTVPDLLREAAEVYESRNKEYGNCYKNFGEWTSKLFQKGIEVKTVDDFNRLGILIIMLSKISRYAENFKNGGHDDSLCDLSVYTNMLRELDADVKEKNSKHTIL
jgi:hypothetical protein